MFDKVMENDMPPINQRIKSLIDNHFEGNIRKFALSIGLDNSTKINRLFLKDKKTNKYPTPSADIILQVSDAFNVSTDWLLKGKLTTEKTVNTINIDNKKINGDKNITNSESVVINDETDYLHIIKKQQDQINKLLEILTKGNG